MDFSFDPNEDFSSAAKRFANGRKPQRMVNDPKENGDSTKRAEFDDGSFIEEKITGDTVSAFALSFEPHKHTPPKVKNQDDEPLDFFNY